MVFPSANSVALRCILSDALIVSSAGIDINIPKCKKGRVEGIGEVRSTHATAEKPRSNKLEVAGHPSFTFPTSIDL